MLVADLAIPAPTTPAPQVSDEEFRQVFRASWIRYRGWCGPWYQQMMERGHGVILVMGSAAALQGMNAPPPTPLPVGPNSPTCKPWGWSWPATASR